MMRLGSVLLASGLLALGGCSLLSGLDELSANANEASGGAAGDAGGGPICLPGKKACSGDCVPIDAPATGCAALSCAPCDLARASAICVGGACVVAQCAAGFEDCNGDSNDGCEADLKSGVTSCGACGASCSLPHANVSCTAGTCAFEGCEVGFENCDGDESNGCEANVQSDPTRCGSCTTSCTVPFGKSATCEQGKCGVSNCAPPLADCDKDSAGSCETNLSENEASCGFCGNACAFTNGNAACAQGVCCRHRSRRDPLSPKSPRTSDPLGDLRTHEGLGRRRAWARCGVWPAWSRAGRVGRRGQALVRYPLLSTKCSERSVKRSAMTWALRGSGNTLGHSAKGRLVVMAVERR